MNLNQYPPTQAVLFDLDGVLYIGDNPIDGAVESVTKIRQAGLAIAGITNTTTQPRRIIAKKLSRLNIPLETSEIYTPAALARQTIAGYNAKLYVRDSLLEDFEGISTCHSNPDYIVMGDMGGEGYSPETLLEISKLVLNGSKILALHKNRFWQKPDGMHLDSGPFIAAIEYATAKQATVLGKPSADFFLGVCKALHVQPSATLMIGDDIESDIGGAKQAGLKTALVQTGKYRLEFVKETGIKADILLPSVAALPAALKLA